MVGIALGSAAPGFGMWALALIAMCGFAVVRCLVRRTSAVISPLVLFTALGYLSLQPWIHPRLPDHHISRFTDTGPWRIVGVVDARPLEFESRTRFVLRAERLQNEQEAHDVNGLLRITVIGDTAEMEQGDRVEIRGRIRSLRNFNNPGGFDFKRSMGFREIRASVGADAKKVSLLEKRAERGWLAWVDRIRSRISQRIDQAGLGPEAAVLKALVVGDQAHILSDTRQVFTRTGTSHILAVSGLHISLVATVAFGVCRWLLSWFPPAIRHAWVRKGAALLTLVPVALYALIAGFSPSTQRALLMVSVFLLAFLVERETDLMNTLAMAALCILVVQPASLFSISFQLSFAAVLSIVYGFDRVKASRSAAAPRGEGRADRVKRGAAVFFGVSLIATWGTLPLGMYYFNTVSVIGVLANCVAIPLMGYLVVVVGLIGTLLDLLSATVAVACYQIGGVVLSKTIAFMEVLAALPFAAFRTITPSGVELALFYLLSWAVFHLATERPKAMDTYPDGTSLSTRAGRRAAWVLIVLCSLGVCADAGYWLYERFGRQDLRVTLLDVGQGSAVLLEFPGGTTALVDGGGFADMAAFDVGASVVAPFLWRRKIATVDTLVLTHANSDHLNGLVFIAANFNVKRLWTNGESRPVQGYEALMRTAREAGIAVPGYADIPRSTPIPHGLLDVVYPPVGFLERVEADRWRRDENNNSLVTRVSLGEVSVLIPGDIMRPAERELVALMGGKLKSSVLIAPHHGSRTSSSEEFLAAVAPQAVLISCGDRAGSGMPHLQILERYAARGAQVYRTDRNGAIQLTTDGRSYRLELAVANQP
jgi:competence protein ComEC